MYQLIPLHSRNYLQKTSIKSNVGTEEGKQPKWNVTLNKRWIWSSCTKLALSVSWTHGLIAQWVRASEWNSEVVGSNPLQANFKESVNGDFFCVWLLIEIFRKKYLKVNEKLIIIILLLISLSYWILNIILNL